MRIISFKSKHNDRQTHAIHAHGHAAKAIPLHTFLQNRFHHVELVVFLQYQETQLLPLDPDQDKVLYQD